jgi:hypothetical protein
MEDDPPRNNGTKFTETVPRNRGMNLSSRAAFIGMVFRRELPMVSNNLECGGYPRAR